MKITDKMIREYLGHNGVECKVRITRNGDVYRHGSPDHFDRSADYWAWIGYRDQIVAEMIAIGYVKTQTCAIAGCSNPVDEAGDLCTGCEDHHSQMFLWGSAV